MAAQPCARSANKAALISLRRREFFCDCLTLTVRQSLRCILSPNCRVVGEKLAHVSRPPPLILTVNDPHAAEAEPGPSRGASYRRAEAAHALELRQDRAGHRPRCPGILPQAVRARFEPPCQILRA